MTLALAWLLGAGAWGVLFSTRLRTPFGLGARLGLGMGLGTALTLWLPALLSFALDLGWGSRTGVLATAVLLVLEARRPSALATLSEEVALARPALRRPGTWALLAGFAFLAALFLYLFTEHSLRIREDGAYSAGYSYNDMAFHATLANSFLKGDNLRPPEYPPLAHHPLGYPFLPDLLAAVLARLGCPLGPAFAVSGTVAALTLVWLFFQLARRWTGSELGAAIAVVLFLGSGGLGAFNLLARVTLGASPAATFYGTDFTFCRDIKIDYTNVVVGTLLPSRCNLYGIILALVVLELLSRALERGLEPRADVVLAGAVAGLAPLVHAHSVVALAFLLGTWIVATPLARWIERDGPPEAVLTREREKLLKWGPFVGPCGLIALPQVAWIARYMSMNASSGGFSHVHLGWMALEGWPQDPPAITKLGIWAGYWITNAGAFLVLVPIAFFLAPFRLKWLALPALVLFTAANVLQLQPWVYDNIRLLTYAHLLAAVPVGALLARLVRASATGKILALELVVLACLTGTCSIVRETDKEFRLCGAEGVALAEAVDRATPAGAVFLTAPTHTCAVSMLAGRRLALGAECWTYTHGVPYRDRVPKVQEIYRGGKDAVAFIQELGIDYVVVGPEERVSFSNLDERFLEGLAKEPALRSGPYSVYRVR